jgi:hypothetical protein
MNDNVIHFPGTQPATPQPPAAPSFSAIPEADGVDLEFIQNSCLILSPVLDELATACAQGDRERVNEMLGAIKRQVVSWPDRV